MEICRRILCFLIPYRFFTRQRGFHSVDMPILRFLAFTVLSAVVAAVSSRTEQIGSLQSVPELERAMYSVVEGTPCVRLLNISGEIGCGNPDRVKVTAPIRRFETAWDHLDQSTAVLLPFNETEAFFQRVLSEPIVADRLTGLLIEYEADINHHLSEFSLDKTFPQAEFAPYKEKDYTWNPHGSGFLLHSYNFPVVLLSERSTMSLREAAKLNEQQNFKYPLNVVEFDLIMQTTKSGTHSSASCLQEGSCLPLGGYSVWSSLPPINVSSLTPKKPIVLALASMDSASFFRDKTPGADSSLSGMIAMLAAVDALSHVDAMNEAEKQLVFLFVTGEAWGYLGSRRFLAELAIGSDSVKGLNMSLVNEIVEVGSVGKVLLKEKPSLFIHTAKESSGTEHIIEAFQKAADSFQSNSIDIEKASMSNPGVPPSSLMSFLNQDASTPGIVIEEFNRVFVNTFYHSVLDDYSNINSSSIKAAASLVARALYLLANNGSGDDSVLQSITVDESLVEDLLGCLLSCDPGLSCKLVKDLITPNEMCANHYVGVLQGPPSSSPYADYVSDTSRFVWNFLANRTSTPREESPQCSKECENSGELCVGLTEDHQGTCMMSTTRYVPAYSTRVAYENDAWKVVPAQHNDEMGKVDPIWTESFWRTLGVRVYKQQSSFSDNLVLLSGISVTLCSFMATLSARSLFLKALKND